MKLRIVLHETHTLAFDGLGNQHGWFAFGCSSFPEGCVDGVEIVAVEIDNVPAEATPFVGEGLEFEDVLDEAIELNLVIVDDCSAVVDFVKSSEHRRFPDLSFLDFAISEHHVRL